MTPRPDRIVFFSNSDLPRLWRDAFSRAMPGARFDVLTGRADEPETIDYAIVWNPPPGELKRMTGLKCVFSLGAGVDHVLRDPGYPRGVPLARVVDPYLTSGMTEYVVQHVLMHHRGHLRSAAAQAARRWDPFVPKPADQVRVGVMGLGVLGLDAARRLRTFGYRLAGWSATRKSEPGVESFAGMPELDAFLARSDILVCLLPLTPETDGILNADRLARLPRGASLINAARGAHVVAADLIAALDRGHLAGATLDVFATEPLPPDDPLWSHPRVIVTPHIASITNPDSTALTMAESIARLKRGERPLHEVDLARGY